MSGVSDEVREGAQGASRVAPGKSGPHEMARGSSSLLSSHGREIGTQDALKKEPKEKLFSSGSGPTVAFSCESSLLLAINY